jgi:predicted nucleotidyltransferase
VERADAITLAERIVDVAGTDDVRMAVITGSVARGLSDDRSDLDVYLYGDRPDVAVLADPHRFDPIGARAEFGVRTTTGWFTKLRCDTRYVDVESVDISLLGDAADALSSPRPAPSWVVKVAAGLRDAIAVRGGDELETWQRRLTYRDETATADVHARVSRLLSPTALFELTAARGDALSFTARLAAVLLDAVALLGAVNRRFIPTDEPKWMPWHLAQLTHRPADVGARIHDALTRPTMGAMADLDALLAETLDLVDTHVPETDTGAARYALGLRPRPPAGR